MYSFVIFSKHYLHVVFRCGIATKLSIILTHPLDKVNCLLYKRFYFIDKAIRQK